VEHQNTAALVELCRTGDQIAIERLVRTHQSAVHRLALSVLDDPSEAEEATQDAFVAALKALESYRQEAAFTTWLYAITLNVCRGRLRQRRMRERVVMVQKWFGVGSSASPSPEGAAITTERDSALWQAIQNLGEKHRLPIILRYYHDLSVTEIAQTLDINEGTVHSRLNTAREQLRVRLKTHDVLGRRLI